MLGGGGGGDEEPQHSWNQRNARSNCIAPSLYTHWTFNINPIAGKGWMGKEIHVHR